MQLKIKSSIQQFSDRTDLTIGGHEDRSRNQQSIHDQTHKLRDLYFIRMCSKFRHAYTFSPSKKINKGRPSVEDK